MFTYNNVLGNFISYSDNFGDLDDDDYEDSEPESEMDNRNISSHFNISNERCQIVESLLRKSNKHADLHI